MGEVGKRGRDGRMRREGRIKGAAGAEEGWRLGAVGEEEEGGIDGDCNEQGLI